MPDGAPQSAMPPAAPHDTVERSLPARFAAVLHAAETLFERLPRWNEFHAEILGVEGVASRLFATPEEMAQFQESEEFAHIQMMLAELRVQSRSQPKLEPTRMITVRLPASLHAALKKEALRRATSVNKLCIATLLEAIDDHEPAQQAAASHGDERPLGNERPPQPRAPRRTPSDS